MKFTMPSRLSLIPTLAAGALALLASGCSTMTQVTTTLGQATGLVTAGQAESLNKSAQAVEKTFQDITPEQEYYIGRAVAATVLSTYRPFDQQQANAYLNLLGQTVAQFSTKPETFGGYHFLLLDTDEVNAFAAPGGLIMISRGMVRCCHSEDELVAVLAHEISHVNQQHGLKAIGKGRLPSAGAAVLAAAGTLVGGQLAQFTEAFAGCISDITSTMINNGYSHTTEFEADENAVPIMKKLGYSPTALVTMLEQMQKQLQPGARGFGTTHPSPKVRIAKLRKLVGTTPAQVAAARQRRFQETMGGI